MSRHYQTLTLVQEHLSRGKPDQARAALQRAIQKDPSDPDLNNAMAIALVQLGQREQATYFAQRAARARPDDAGVLATLGGLLSMGGKPEEAILVLERACALAPGAAESCLSLVNAYHQVKRNVAAARACRTALEHHPGHVTLTTKLVVSLLHAGRADEAVAAAREARERAPGHADFARALAFALNYVDEREPGETFVAHVAAGRALDPVTRERPARREVGDGALRVGLVSPDLNGHSVSKFVEPLLEHRDRGALEVVCFMNSSLEDGASARLRALSDGWHNVRDLDDAQLASLVREERIDVLLDLAGLTGGNRLGAMALRAAAVQGTYLGYPNTTGLACVDFRIVDSITDPPGAEAWCVERLARIDPCFLCFKPPEGAQGTAPAPSASLGHVTFASFNTLLKLNDQTAAAWAAVLGRVPGSRLLLKCAQMADPEVRAATHARFGAHGIDAGRVELLDVTRETGDHLALYARADIALDPFPYNGTTTTCEAMWMGVPVVTLRGRVHAARVGASLLTAVGEPGLIAASVEEYVGLAAALAADAARMEGLRAGLRGKMRDSVLCDGAGFARRFASLVRREWAAVS